MEPCRFLERLSAQVTYLPVDGTGRVAPSDLRKATTPRTILVRDAKTHAATNTRGVCAYIRRVEE
ncbi:MAG: hypothetical protein WAV78_51660 [Xanthobacteraceae bacterium]